MIVPVLLIFLAAAAFADIPADPRSDVYTDLQRWETFGYVHRLPEIRPYPIQLLQALLTEIVNGDTDIGPVEKRRAEAHLSRLSQDLKVSPATEYRARLSPDGYAGVAAAGLDALYRPLPFLSASAGWRLHFVDGFSNLSYAEGRRRGWDWFNDWSDFELLGRSLEIRQGLVSQLAVGTERVYAQAGLSRTAIGPFFEDGLVLSPDASFSGHFSFTARMNIGTYSLLFLDLGASDDRGGGIFPEKHLVYHRLSVNPVSWLELSFFESVVYGGRFEPLYFVPLSVFYYSQALTGFEDNSLIGVSARLSLPSAVRFPIAVFADDVHFNDLARFDFETKYKLAAQVGAEWAIAGSPVEWLGADYLAVMPYMYTHWDENPGVDIGVPNYSNYTHLGEPLGPTIEPNSDRWTVSARLRLLDWFRTRALVRLFRHANASEGFETGGDGDIFDPGYEGSVPTFQDETRFLVQETIEHVLQLGLVMNVELPFERVPGSVKLNADFRFDRVWNADLVTGAKDSRFYASFGFDYAY
jgi:hypothetical protein